jgi:ParB family chromosome partitioning protein
VNSRKKDQPYTSKLRGVAALLGEPPSRTVSEIVSVTAIIRSSEQPRRYFDPDKQKQLACSIREHGILEPLLVRPFGSEQYELVAGERRYQAALEVELTEVPVIIKNLNDDEALQIALIENLQRVDLNPIEETEGMLKLLGIHLNQAVDNIVSLLYRMENENKGKVTQNVLGNQEGQKIIEIFESVGTISWESFTSSRLPLLKLPEEILKALRTGKIAFTKATAIARLKDPVQRKALLDEAVAENLSLAQIKEKIKKARPTNETITLRHRIKEASSRLYSSKCWNNPKKQRKLERLLVQIQELLSDEPD